MLERPKDPSCPASNDPLPVLVVSESSLVRSRLASSLSRSGYRTVDAQSAGAALDLTKHSPPIAILLDVRLCLDGAWALVCAARCLAARPRPLPVIAFAALGAARERAARIECHTIATVPLFDPGGVNEVLRLVDHCAQAQWQPAPPAASAGAVRTIPSAYLALAATRVARESSPVLPGL